MVLMVIVLVCSFAAFQMAVDRKIRPTKKLQTPRMAIKKNRLLIQNQMAILLPLGTDLLEVAKVFLPDNSMRVEVRKGTNKWWIHPAKFLRRMLQPAAADVT